MEIFKTISITRVSLNIIKSNFDTNKIRRLIKTYTYLYLIF